MSLKIDQICAIPKLKMSLLELATVRLLPSHSPDKSKDFETTWSRACDLASKAANGLPFQLYRAVSSRDQGVYYFVGGWETDEDHIKFLSTPDAVTLAQGIGQYMTIDVVRHIEGNVRDLNLGSKEATPKRLRAVVYKVPEAQAADWVAKWNGVKRTGGSGGWDLSAVVQKKHKAYREMGEAMNSVSAFGGTDELGNRTWVWVESGEQGAGTVAVFENIEPELLEMDYILG
jgi:hypothetical protein